MCISESDELFSQTCLSGFFPVKMRDILYKIEKTSNVWWGKQDRKNS